MNVISERYSEQYLDVREQELTEGQTEYLKELKATCDFLRDELQSNWWVIGGLAKDAYVQDSEFRVKGSDGRIRDLDILVEGRFEDFENIRKRNPGKIPLGGFLNRYIRVTDKDSYLCLGSTKISVPREVFRTQEVNLFGVDFPTLPLETLFHLYCLRGKMRPKDFLSALSIGRLIKKNPTDGISERMYEGFHRFAKDFRKKKLNPQVLMEEASRLYTRTPLGKMLPLNHPSLRPVILHIWDAAGIANK